MRSRQSRKTLMVCLAISLCYLAIAVATSATRAPWCDEAFFGETGFNMAAHGRLASTVEPPSVADDPKTEGTDRFTFYALPLHLVLQGAWFKVVGFGLLRLRLISITFGLVAIAAWYLILESLFAQAWITICGVALIALDYSFLHSASEGRMDMMSAALGFLGLASFLRFRARSLDRALWLAFWCEAAAFYTHPIGGGLSAAALCVTVLWFDRRALRLRHILPAAVPYLVLTGAWGLYILQDPHIFAAQFFSNSAGRLSAWKQPLAAVLREIGARWEGPFGLTPGAGLAKNLKGVVLLAYIGGVLYGFRKLRTSQGLISVLAIAIAVLLTFVESTKAASYLVHVVPYMAAALGIWAGSWIAHGGVRRAGVSLLLLAVLGLNLAGSAYLIRKDDYHQDFLVAARYLRENRVGNEPVIGMSVFCFSLGFAPGWIDDWRLGYYNHANARWIVEDSTYHDYWKSAEEKRPDVAAHIAEVLKNYRVVFQTGSYTIYEHV